jgi:hypothetical protein
MGSPSEFIPPSPMINEEIEFVVTNLQQYGNVA